MGMKVQSTSIMVTSKCSNNCKFCSARMRKPKKNTHDNRNIGHEFVKRLSFTGTGEPLMDVQALKDIARSNRQLPSPYKWIEIQTSGITEHGYLDEKSAKFLYDEIGVTTVSLSLSDIFDNDNNLKINGTPNKHRFKMETVCKNIKSRFNLRLSLNISDVYNDIDILAIFRRATELGADQVTFRKLYHDDDSSKPSMWVREHDVEDVFWDNLTEYVTGLGNRLETLPFGAAKYSIHGMSVVVDDNCMASKETPTDIYKYLIIDEGRIYSRWGDTGSLIF